MLSWICLWNVKKDSLFSKYDIDMCLVKLVVWNAWQKFVEKHLLIFYSK